MRIKSKFKRKRELLKRGKIKNNLSIWETSALAVVGTESLLRGPFRRGDAMCFPNCSKYLLVILNIATFVAGGALFVAGMILLLESGIMNWSVLKLFFLIQYNGTIKFGLILMIAGYLLIAVGALIMVFAVLGICGAWKKIKCCLLVFIICTVLGILLQAAVVGLFINLNGRSDEWLQGEMLTLLESYEGPDKTDVYSTGFNNLFMKARCCGITSYTDLTVSNWHTGADDIPASCCKGVDSADDYANVGNCPSTPENYYTEGCYTVVRNTIFSYLLIVSITCGIALLLEVTVIVLSCMVMDQTKNQIRPLGASAIAKPAKPYIGIDAVLKSKGKK